jgi:TerC family integral membrane protein
VRAPPRGARAVRVVADGARASGTNAQSRQRARRRRGGGGAGDYYYYDYTVEAGTRRSVAGRGRRRTSVTTHGMLDPRASDDELEIATGMSIDELEQKQENEVKAVAAIVGAACAFGAFVGATQGADKASEYFAGYLLEQSLSVDNLFVFVLVFDYFKVPLARQNRVLNYGIWGAVVMRAIMIGAGVEIIEHFEPILLVFAGILIFSSYKLLAEGDEEEDEDMSENAIVKFCSSLIPVSKDYDGDNFWTLVDGAKMATPLLLVLAVIELSDVVFAVDSIPAVFGVTKDPFIVYTSNMFAILSLRQLFGLVSKAVGELEYLQTAVALVLGFIGVKMVAEFGGFHVPTDASLAVVASMLGGGVAASVWLPKQQE